jgi:maleate cis-trans isomerase
MREVPTVDTPRLVAFIDALDTKGCYAMVLLATDPPTFSAIAAIEQRTGMPVLTSNQTTLWVTLAAIAVRAAAGRF